MAAKPCLFVFGRSVMSLSAGLASLDSHSLGYLSSIITEGNIFVSANLLDWTGPAVLHLEAQGPWSPAFECFLLDRGLAVDLTSPCRTPSKVITCSLHMPRPVWNIVAGTQFVCKADLSVEGAKRVAQVDSHAMASPCGFHDLRFPVSFVHLFAGAFCGWHQAQEWLSVNHHIPFAEHTLAVEKDFTTASYGATSIEADLINRGDAVDTTKRSLMVCCDVAETRWLNLIRTGANLMVTKSFPCQPFSKGGSKGGLNTIDGRSIVESILKCRWLQPIGIALENVDDFKIHEHRPIIFELLKWAGYSCKWQMIHDLAEIAPAHRRRWLSVFIRKDLSEGEVPLFQVASQNMSSWSHEMYQFSCPKPLLDQMNLDRVLMAQYGDPRMMPPSRRLQARNLVTNTEVLEMRCPTHEVKLATLVSSYSTQHVLPRKHLLWKGIFAELTQTKSGFRFMCPAMWTSLLGNIFELRLPKQLGLIFQILGNAIATPHAAMGLSVMTSLLDLQFGTLTIPELILAFWNDRLTTCNAMIIQDGDGFLIVKPSTLIQSKILVRHHQILHPDHDATWVFEWPDGSRSVIQTRGSMTANGIFGVLGFPENVVSCWALMGCDHHGIFNGTKNITDRKAIFGFCFVPDLLSDPPSCLVDVEPTQKWTQVPQSNEESKCNLKCTLPDKTIRFVDGRANQTIDELCQSLDLCPATLNVMAVFDNPSCGEPFTVPKHKLVRDVANCSLVLTRCIRPQKRHVDQLSPSQTDGLLEVVSLTNQTKFAKCEAGDTILTALLNAGFPKEMIVVVPLNNGRKINFDTIVNEMPSKAVRLTAAPLRGGTKDDAMGQDGILKEDPWLAYKPLSQTSASNNVRWDELILPDDHPWHVKGGERLFQISYLQVGPEKGGVAFVAKQNLQKILQIKPPSPCLLLIPALRDLGRKDPSFQSFCLPVQQIIVKEPNGRTYKRVTLPVVLRGPVEFRIDDKPNTIAIKSSSFCELVIEVLEALAPPATMDSLKNFPLEFFKKFVSASKIPLVEASCYAYRKIKGKEGNIIHQALLKIPETNRKQFLQISGCDEVFIRQFINDGDDVDHSVLPRYFPVSVQDCRQARHLGESLGDCFFGLALTAKGICIRSANSALKTARQAILQSDVRFTDANRHIVCKHYFVAQGFPFSMSHTAIIDAVMQAIKKPSIPMRSFKIAGMLSWVLAFEEIPTQTSFTFKVADQSYEVLLMPQNEIKIGKTTKVKETKKGKDIWKKPQTFQPSPFVATPASTSSASDSDKRLAVLETRVNSLETSHSHLANRVETRFDDIADQLKKVLSAVSAPRQRDPTGETPPGKLPKTS